MVALHVLDEDFYVLYAKVADLLHKWLLLNCAGHPRMQRKETLRRTCIHSCVVTDYGNWLFNWIHEMCFT